MMSELRNSVAISPFANTSRGEQDAPEQRDGSSTQQHTVANYTTSAL